MPKQNKLIVGSHGKVIAPSSTHNFGKLIRLQNQNKEGLLLCSGLVLSLDLMKQ